MLETAPPVLLVLSAAAACHCLSASVGLAPAGANNWQLPISPAIISDSCIQDLRRACPGRNQRLSQAASMEPIYTPQNTTKAYQLNWSLALFGKCQLPDPAIWLEDLKDATEPDGVRILSAKLHSDHVIQFLISTRPETTPPEIIRSIKGRLQYRIRDQIPKAFRRNYHLHSTGEVSCAVLDQYVAGQAAKHPMADDRVQADMEAVQFHDPQIDLAQPTIGTYGQYLNSIQVVLENSEGWHETRADQLQRVRDIIIRSAIKKQWQLSRIGLLSNHVHVLLGLHATTSPETAALSLMNNIAFVYDMKPVLKFSFYTGTFGGYDRGVTRQAKG